MYILTQGDAVLSRDLLTRAKVGNHVITCALSRGVRCVLTGKRGEKFESAALPADGLVKFDDLNDAERLHTRTDLSICNFSSTHESI